MCYLSKTKAVLGITCLIVILCYLLWVPCSLGESVHIYKYRGKDGAWRFSDTHKDRDHEVETREAITSAPRPKIRLVREKTKNGDATYAHNDYHGPCEIDVQFVKTKNVQIVNTSLSINGKDTDSRRFVVAKHGKQSLFTVQPVATTRSWQYRFTYRCTWGSAVGK